MAANAGVMLIRASLKDIRPRSPSEGTQVEARQNIFAADAAKAAGVHLVFTSVGSANRQTGGPHLYSK